MNKRKRCKKNRKQKIIILLVSVMILICGIISILKFDPIRIFVLSKFIKLERIEIVIENQTIEVGENIAFKIKYYPENANFYTYTVESSNDEVIKVKNDNMLMGNEKGYATLSVECNGKESKKDINVIVRAKEISLQDTEKQIKIGEKYQVIANIIPSEASEAELYYLSDNEEVAKVNQFGEVEGIKDGEAIINVFNKNKEVKNEIKIIVLKEPVEKIELDETSVEIGKNQKYIIRATVSPEKATYKNVIWKSNDENILSIDENGIIKTKEVGKTSVIAITDNGDKQVECVFNIVNNPKVNKKLYAKSENAIRNGPNKNFNLIGTTKKNEEIELLKLLDNGWAKVRNKNGIVGYSLYSLYDVNVPETDNTSNGARIKNVPYLNQISLGYPTGCEAVSATMVLKFAGYNISASQVVDATPTDTKGKYYDNSSNAYYGGNPFKVFVGHPSVGKSKGSYGCFAEPIVMAMKKFAGDRVKNISNCGENTLFEYINKGKPIVVWGIKNAESPKKGVTWNYPDGSGKFEEIIGEHCFVLIGYDDKYVYLNDPSMGQNVKQPRDKFISNWRKLYSQAIVIE